MNTKCTCGNQACQVRESNSLLAFCQMTRTASGTAAKRIIGYATYAEALKHANGAGVRSVGNYLGGSPRRFVVSKP